MAVGVGRSLGRSLLVGCLVPVLCFGWLGLIGLGFGLLFPLLPRGGQQMIAPLALGTWALTLIPAVFVVSLGVIFRRNRALDRTFARFGPGRALAPVARAWASTVDGRELNAWFSKGPMIELYLSCAPRTNGGIGSDGTLARMAAGVSGREPISLPSGRVAIGADAAWMRRFTDDGAVRDALAVLLDDAPTGRPTVSIQADAVKYMARYIDLAELDADRVDALVHALGVLAAAADRLPTPAEPVEATGLLARMRTQRGSLGLFLGVVFGAVALLLGLSVVVGTMVVVLATR